ncbi:MAG TPA: GGDEF domain-containing protein [Rubrobacteraceae bacterium]|nr:GGDEF domain-containing protein [Rubrobacteraceae bacterium]
MKEDAISADEKPHLVVLAGPGLGDFYVLGGDDVVLGNDPFHADMVVRDIDVEPRHAEIRQEPRSGEYILRGLVPERVVSVNGVSLGGGGNGHKLSEGDRISLGDSILEFSRDPVWASFHHELHRLINLDYLTGLLAKNRFDEEFEHYLEQARLQKFPVSTLMADIDNLKKINDAHGHLLGEFVVGEIGRIIGEVHEEEGRQATRFGGDEYQTCLPHLTKPEAREIAEEVRRRVETYPFERDGATVAPTLSLGVATCPEDGTTRAELTRAADEALYRAKRAGGNTVSL